MAPRFLFALPALLAGILVLQQPVITPRPPLRPKMQPVRILGVLTLVGQSGQESPAGNLRIELPETDVWLESAVTSTRVSVSVTQLDGRFRLVAPRPGTYRVCVASMGCSEDFAISDTSTWRRAAVAVARSMFHQRSGIAMEQPYTAVERPREQGK